MKYIMAAVALASFGAGWFIQGLRWDIDAQAHQLESAKAISANVSAVAAKMDADRIESEQIRAAYLEYKKGAELEISDLESRISRGPERLYIKANCPAVPPARTDASRASAGTAELDATATGYYFALERGLAQQYSLLQLCRSELKKRSQQKAP